MLQVAQGLAESQLLEASISLDPQYLTFNTFWVLLV